MAMNIEIRIWLIRILCFVSYVVGLVCYALSSTSTHLLGKWTWWKILLYVIVSIILCVLYYVLPKRRQDPQDPISYWLGVYFTIFVLIVSEAYTSISDEKMEGSKPDAYILVSWAAFAVSSLCLSRQTHYGFEVDLLIVFWIALVTELARIKLWHVIFGLCFGMVLFNLRAYLDAPPRPLAPPPSDDDTGNPLAQQLKNVIEALRNENQNLIRAFSGHVDNYINSNNNGPVDENWMVDRLLESERFGDLQKEVKAFVEAGFEEECCQLYSSWRREFLEEYLSTTFGFQVEELNDENMMEKTECCKKAFTAAIKILLPNEKSLFGRVFQGLELSPAADIAFREFCRQSLMPLLRFADALLMRNHPRDLTRRINDKVQDLSRSMNRILRQTLDFWLRDFKSMYENQNSFSRRSEVLVFWSILLLKIDINERLYSDNNYDFLGPESIIEKVMRELSDYYAENRGKWVNEHRSLLSSLNTWLLDRLEGHLETQLEKRYMKTPDQHFVYMVNNLNHVKIEAEELRLQPFLDNDWFNKINSKVQERIELYHRSSWNDVLDLLQLDTNEKVEPSVLAVSMKNNLYLFNQRFEEIFEEQASRQSTWHIFDEELWEQIIKSLEDTLFPAYEKFFNKICEVLGNDDDECIKYQPTQINGQLQKLLRYDIHWGIERGRNNSRGRDAF